MGAGLVDAIVVLLGGIEHPGDDGGDQRQSADRLPGRSRLGAHGRSVRHAGRTGPVDWTGDECA